MAKLDFPSTPISGDKYPDPPVVDQPVYTWDGEKWITSSEVGTDATLRTTVNIAGGRSFDVAVPEGKNFARLSGVICPTTANQLTLIIQVSLQTGVFLTASGDYATNGFFHFVSTTPTAVNAQSAVAVSGLQVATGNFTAQYPLFFDGMMALKRADTTNSRFNGDFRAATYHSTGGFTHSFLHSHVTTSSGTFGSILAFRIASNVGDNWGAGSWLYVDWM